MQFINEIHMLTSVGGGSSQLSATDMLKPSLARGDLQCLGATTFQEYRKHIEQDGALAR